MQKQTPWGTARRRVMIFIDGSNLYHVLKQTTDKSNLDYRKFAEKLCGDRELIRTYYYNIRQESPENPKLAESQDRFLNTLYETDYLEVKLGIWKPRGQTMVEKGVDVMIASDLISHAYEDHYDTAILVSGDADFYPALQVVKDTGKQVEVAAFDANLSSEAARIADVLIRFDRSYFDDLWMSQREKNSAMRTARYRSTVSDEAASPNGENKTTPKTDRAERRTFADRYAVRRNALNQRQSVRATANGHQVRKPTQNVRRTVSRRSLSNVLNEGTNSQNGRVNSRVTPPDMVGKSIESSSSEAGASAARNDERRMKWVARMFGTRR